MPPSGKKWVRSVFKQLSAFTKLYSCHIVPKEKSTSRHALGFPFVVHLVGNLRFQIAWKGLHQLWQVSTTCFFVLTFPVVSRVVVYFQISKLPNGNRIVHTLSPSIFITGVQPPLPQPKSPTWQKTVNGFESTIRMTSWLVFSLRNIIENVLISCIEKLASSLIIIT